MKSLSNPVEIIQVSYCPEGKEIRVGRLATRRGQIWFEYDHDFLNSGLQLSPIKLPLQSSVFSGAGSPFENLFGLFNDSLPDGWGRLLLDRAMTARGIDYRELTPLDRLAYVGNQGMGALIYKPDYSGDTDISEVVDLNKISREVEITLEGGAPESLEELYQLGGSSSGARPKVLVGYNQNENRIIHGQRKLPKGFDAWMVKFASSTDQRDVGKIEYAYSLMARSAGIEIPETKLFQGNQDKYWFGIKRFDRNRNNRIHLHSVAGLLHADHRIPSLDYDSILRCAFLLQPDIQEAIKIFRIAAFNVFAHNRDDHSKNFSFLMNNVGEWRFAPAYDLTFSNGPGGEHSTMVNGEGRSPNHSHLLRLAEKFRIRKGEAIIAEVQESISHWPEFAKQAGVEKASIRIIEKKLR
ncbi:MAG: type II toxin-antitoxin system HipA family toxin [Bacteroidetes bacterium]|nr:type II toxin-antitoxin system HipA family toxin [Bacteroidota bacterium]MBU1720480.1 type II toxin-antitoxin system HipA family toxin [Bacteroidota bacterium]